MRTVVVDLVYNRNGRTGRRVKATVGLHPYTAESNNFVFACHFYNVD